MKQHIFRFRTKLEIAGTIGIILFATLTYITLTTKTINYTRMDTGTIKDCDNGTYSITYSHLIPKLDCTFYIFQDNVTKYYYCVNGTSGKIVDYETIDAGALINRTVLSCPDVYLLSATLVPRYALALVVMSLIHQ
jgi:hypothetical protein